MLIQQCKGIRPKRSQSEVFLSWLVTWKHVVSVGKRLLQKNNNSIYICEILQEALAQKTDSSLFMFGSHSKKRPNNVVLGVWVFVFSSGVFEVNYHSNFILFCYIVWDVGFARCVFLFMLIIVYVLFFIPKSINFPPLIINLAHWKSGCIWYIICRKDVWCTCSGYVWVWNSEIQVIARSSRELLLLSFKQW